MVFKPQQSRIFVAFNHEPVGGEATSKVERVAKSIFDFQALGVVESRIAQRSVEAR